MKLNIRLTLLRAVSRKIFCKRVPNQVRWRVCTLLFLFFYLRWCFTMWLSLQLLYEGFHVSRRIWKPTEGEALNCFYERGNVVNPSVGHLPREISRITKFILDRNATVTVKLSSSHYRRSPLVHQGGLEIRCVVTVTTPSEFN